MVKKNTISESAKAVYDELSGDEPVMVDAPIEQGKSSKRMKELPLALGEDAGKRKQKDGYLYRVINGQQVRTAFVPAKEKK